MTALMWSYIRHLLYVRPVWVAAFQLLPRARLARTEMRVLVMCHLNAKGRRAFDPWEIEVVLHMRKMCGGQWFDTQLLFTPEEP